MERFSRRHRPFETAAPGPYAGRGPKNYRRDQVEILEDVCELLAHDRFVDASDIEVDIDDDRVITLTGRVESREMKRRSEDLAASIRGVEDVRNELGIMDPTDQRLQTAIATGVY
jgi:osmotically-inducible protein OsmY